MQKSKSQFFVVKIAFKIDQERFDCARQFAFKCRTKSDIGDAPMPGFINQSQRHINTICRYDWVLHFQVRSRKRQISTYLTTANNRPRNTIRSPQHPTWKIDATDLEQASYHRRADPMSAQFDFANFTGKKS